MKIGTGVFLIFLVVNCRTNIKKISLGNKGMFLCGILTGGLSGLAVNAGQLGTAFFLGPNLFGSKFQN